MNSRVTSKRGLARLVLLVFMLMAAPLSGFAQKPIETIDATARGTSTQMGKNINIKILIYSWSTPEDQQALREAFKKGQSNGLAKALEKMNAVGRIQVPGTVGYELGYAKTLQTENGRIVRFAAKRRIAFGEAYNDTRSMKYNLTAGEFVLNDKEDKDKSTGTLFPAAQLIINDKGELQWELYKNPWQLVGIIDWNAEKQ
jgi:hypothetical protein